MARTPREVMQDATMDEAVSGAFRDLEELGQEMQDWFDNMPENFQGGSKGDEVSNAADALSNISSVDTPAFLADVKLQYVYNTKARSRSDRRDNAVSMLHAAIEKLQDEDLLKGIRDHHEGEEQMEALEEFQGELENARDEAEAVDFPGMY